MRDYDVRYVDIVEEHDLDNVKEFAQEQNMLVVHGVMCGEDCACTLPQHIDVDCITEMQAAYRTGEFGGASWPGHFELIWKRTPDGRIWADNSNAEYTHIGRYEKRVVYRYPQACRLMRRYAERIGTTYSVLHKDVEIQTIVPNVEEPGPDYAPPIYMKIRERERVDV